jgi:hypothetical protein
MTTFKISPDLITTTSPSALEPANRDVSLMDRIASLEETCLGSQPLFVPQGSPNPQGRNDRNPLTNELRGAVLA